MQEQVFVFLRTAGPSMSPFNAWVFLKGLETLEIRMRAHCAGALAVAEWLRGQAKVRRVYHPGLPDHPGHALARRQQRDFGGIVSLEVDGDQDSAWRVIDALRLFSITANLGDTKSTVTHPTTTTHQRMSAAERAKAGITPGLIRLSIGLEAVEDLKADLGAALRVA
jgi:O-succinylhomoserine sulfhydrylase